MIPREATRALCPRCGSPGYEEVRNVQGRTYFYFVHVTKEDGKRRVHKCYLGPRLYRYVERLNPLGLAGLIDRDRFIQYIMTILAQLTPEQKQWLREMVCRNQSEEQPKEG